ncbi:BZ3500_MvSof-1268-A1-R1_Chr1-1g01166 [Microbotryum saponariae]|uniref:BZ3500_MvSof-1268-A1-R1_Chr1-1g01166 protein n=1 Tax=Microbotryum saponariae TaxID=289078 RepID=A0A2X0KD50_9BASI|nr:BZ3500_MvSof-1268-A1-R1_Chr1-1g01166 [Microbotryum saponariae]SCZ93554.1 BZ3501_MvSof-1269-A2-R1_Chr1-1g00762 [Microbotryum saponariae]
MHLTRRRHAAEEKIPLCVQCSPAEVQTVGPPRPPRLRPAGCLSAYQLLNPLQNLRRQSSASSTLPPPQHELIPGASASHYARGSDITQQDLDDFGQEGVWVDEEDLGGMDLASENALESTVYTRVDNSDSPPRPTYRQLYVTPPNTARREGYLKYITLDAELRKSLRAKLFGRFLEFRRDSKLHLRPLVSEDDLDDHDAPPPCACNCILTREIILYDVTAFYKLQVTFCASESRCATDVERLAQLGFISSTASMPMTAFSFRLVEQAHASWKVSPRALTGYADGLKEYYSGCGWGRGHYTGHPWDKDLRKQLQRAIDEYRALVTCEKDSGDLLVGTVDSYRQTREKNSKHDVQGIVPDIFLAEEEVQAMKAEVEASVRPTKKAADDGAGSTSSRVVDTGLVACVCRHDVNLKMVNLERSGEKLYYALAILKCISERLPENAKIGVLYDIARNFKHHIEKTKCAYFPIICHPRQLLPKLFKRLEFATSVFHAYAHIWSCQVEFNPRLIPNFGLTDGEGSVRAKARVGEEEARIGAEVRQALAWIEDEKTRITNTLSESIDPADAKSIFGTEDVEEIRGRALIILDRRMELLQLRECSWSQNDHFFDVWLETRGQSEGQSEPMPPALSELRGLHQRLNATGRTVKKAKHHQRPVHNRSGTRGSMGTSGLDDSAGPPPLARDVQQVRAIEAQMDMSDGAELANEVGPLSAQLLEQDGEMGSSSDESYGDDFAGQEDEYFSDV